MAKRKHPEDDLQRAVKQLLDIYERQGKLRYFAVPNGGKRNRVEAAIMNGLGVRAGVPDLCILIANGGPTLFLELKAPKGVMSENQEDWCFWLTEHGRPAFVVNSLETVKGILSGAFVGREAA